MNCRSSSMLEIPTALIFVQKKGFVLDVFIQLILKIGSLCRILIQHFNLCFPDAALFLTSLKT